MSLPIVSELLLPLPEGAKPESEPARERRSGHGARPAAAHPAHAPARSGVERLRATTVTSAGHVGLTAIEQAVVSGSAERLRTAIRRLPPGLARAAAAPAEAEAAPLEDEEDTSASPPAHVDRQVGAERPTAHVVPHTRETGGQTAAARLDLPLPDGGEARVAVEMDENGGPATHGYRVDVELELAQLGTVDLHLVADESRLLCRVDCDDPQARAQLEDALASLRVELASATGKSVSVALERKQVGATRLEPLGGLDAYA
jgi:hypothetical protein